MKTTQEFVTDLFKSILAVIAENSSKKYGLVAFNHTKKNLIKDFPFFNLITITDSSIKIDRRINSVDTKEIKKIFEKIIGILGPDVLKLLIREQLDEEDLKYITQIGVRF